MNEYVIVTENGKRTWMGDDEDHAREQHEDAFPNEPILEIRGGAAARLEEIRTELRAEYGSLGDRLA